jgi:hypothetical protein
VVDGEPGSLPDTELPSSPKTRSAGISATTAIAIRTPKSANTPPDCHNMVARAGPIASPRLWEVSSTLRRPLFCGFLDAIPAIVEAHAGRNAPFPESSKERAANPIKFGKATYKKDEPMLAAECQAMPKIRPPA